MDVGVSKGEFASIIGVSPGRVSQYLSEGKISAAALVGSGRNAKINVEQAKRDLRLTLDIGQRMGNGLDTRLYEDATPLAGERPTAPAQQMPQTGVDHEIKQQKLEQIRRANRNAALADAQARGQLMETATARAEMSHVASSMLQVFEGSLTDFASAIAAEFQVPQRDALHLLRREFRSVRITANRQMLALGAAEAETGGTPLEAGDIERIN